MRRLVPPGPRLRQPRASSPAHYLVDIAVNRILQAAGRWRSTGSRPEKWAAVACSSYSGAMHYYQPSLELQQGQGTCDIERSSSLVDDTPLSGTSASGGVPSTPPLRPVSGSIAPLGAWCQAEQWRGELASGTARLREPGPVSVYTTNTAKRQREADYSARRTAPAARFTTAMAVTEFWKYEISR